MEDFGQLLKRLRVSRGLKLRDLAKLAGVDPGYVSKLEHGERNPPSRTVTAAFAEALRLLPGGDWHDRLFLASGHIPPDLDPAVLLAACRAIREEEAA